MDFNIKFELKKIILNCNNIKNTYNKTYTNSKYSLDLIIDELLYFFKSGVSWRYLRSPIKYQTLFWHFTRFVKNNIFLKLFKKIITIFKNKKTTNNYTFLIDSTTVYNKYGVNKIGRNKFYKNKKTTKISLMTDINGFPLSILFMKGNYHDNSVFDKHIRDALIIVPNKNKKIMADKAYSSKKNYDLLESHNMTHIIPPRKNMKMAKHYRYDKNEYTKRIKIENIFARLKMFRRLNVRYEKLCRNFSAFVYLAFSFIAVNILNKNM